MAINFYFRLEFIPEAQLPLIMKRIYRQIASFPLFDIIISPFAFIAGLILLLVRRIGFKYLKITRKVLLYIGVIPIRNHYYEPFVRKKTLLRPLSDVRYLPGIDLNTEGQLAMLNKFKYSDELYAVNEHEDLAFQFKNGSFEAGDAEYWYNIVRLIKPRTIIEIGSGNSTKVARLAIKINQNEVPEYNCEHICIEPYEMPWLERLGVVVLRNRVEEMDVSFFKKLKENDILFIDSSHIIRPQGDVLYEFLQLLPNLNKGVIVHIHDIFTPRDYRKEWVLDRIRFWNEQYLLEAFLTSNKNWKIIGALNHLKNNHFAHLKEKCPRLSVSHEPASFYIVKEGEPVLN